MTIVSALKTADILDLVSACENIQGFLRHGGKDGVRTAEYGVCQEIIYFAYKRFDFNETPRFPLYGGIKWKTRSVSKDCLFCLSN